MTNPRISYPNMSFTSNQNQFQNRLSFDQSQTTKKNAEYKFGDDMNLTDISSCLLS